MVAATDQEPVEAKLESIEKKLKASDQFTFNKNLQRALHVADQIARDNVDITGDYEDWQLIAFSLATFGEP